MNPLVHCYALAVLLDDPSKQDDARQAVMPTSLERLTGAGPCLALVLARAASLNRVSDAKELRRALCSVVAPFSMPMDVIELLIPDNEFWTIQKELELFRRVSRATAKGLACIFDAYLDALSKPPVGTAASPVTPPRGSGTSSKAKKKRRGHPPRRALG